MEKQPKQTAKILLHDIEAGPNLGYVYGKYDQNVVQFHSEWELMAYGFKWLGQRAVESYAQDQYSEEDLLSIAHEAMSEADVVVAHNGDNFDQKKLNAKFLEYGFEPPVPYRSVDTLKIARRYFAFNSNRLGDLAEKLGVQRKQQLGGFATWIACIEGDQKAWDKLKRYNKQDVRVLEDVYLRMLPWIDNHPAVNILNDVSDGCPKCGSTNLILVPKPKLNKTTTVDRYQCTGCSGYSYSRKSNPTDTRFTN